MIVADANLLAYLVIPGDRTDEAVAVLNKDPVWVAPPLWRSEMRSVVHKYVVRGVLTVARAVALMEQVDRILGGREAGASNLDILTLASGSLCSTYDCEYVALATALGVPLVTTDRAVLRAFPKNALSPTGFLVE